MSIYKKTHCSATTASFYKYYISLINAERKKMENIIYYENEQTSYEEPEYLYIFLQNQPVGIWYPQLGNQTK